MVHAVVEWAQPVFLHCIMLDVIHLVQRDLLTAVTVFLTQVVQG